MLRSGCFSHVSGRGESLYGVLTSWRRQVTFLALPTAVRIWEIVNNSLQSVTERFGSLTTI